MRLLLVALFIAGCGSTHSDTDGGGPDTGGALDAPADAGTSDGGSLDAMDTGALADGGPSDGGATPDVGPCMRDEDCTAGAEWCVEGSCVPCDDSGRVCDILCPDGWSTYTRHGCSPCECAPPNECTEGADCAAGHCYAGAYCTDWCPAGDPSCCWGNTCGVPGCTEPPPIGCQTIGCARGSHCEIPATGCTSSACTCTAGSWSCTADCGGGTCVPD